VPDRTGRPAAAVLRVTREGATISATFEGAAEAIWQLQLRGVAAVVQAAGGEVQADRLGIVIRPATGSRTLTIELPPA
jgi:hypothetical protein